MSSKKQKAGDNATQIQAGLIQVGIDEKRVKEIIREENQLALKEMKIIAEDAAIKRLDDYSNVLVPKLVEAKMLESFADPSIQVLFKQSERTAICTEREKDYELLSELLIHRIKRDGNYTIDAAIEKAISEVNNISEEALLGLTLIFVISSYVPKTADINVGLNTLDNLYGTIIGDNLLNFSDQNWIENLEITNCIRINPLSTRKRLDDYFFDKLSSYSCLGIKKETEKYKNAMEILHKNKLPISVLTENLFDNDYVRINKVEMDNLKKIVLSTNGNMKTVISINEEQEVALKQIENLYDENNLIKDKFIEKMKSYKNINLLIDWWNNTLLETYFSITPIGKVIAHTNAKSINSTLPDLN